MATVCPKVPDINNLRQPGIIYRQISSLCDRANKIHDRIGVLEHELVAVENPVIRRAVELANELDPNWYSVSISDAGKEKVGEDTSPSSPSVLPDLRVFMNGPLHGDRDLAEQLHDILSKPNSLKNLAEYHREHNCGFPRLDFCYINPNHTWELAVGKVVFYMENQQRGYLSVMNPDGSFVIKPTDYGDWDWRYTLARLNDDLNPLVGDNNNGSKDVVGVSYVPFRCGSGSVFGHQVFQSVEEFIAVQQEWDEKNRK